MVDFVLSHLQFFGGCCISVSSSFLLFNGYCNQAPSIFGDFDRTSPVPRLGTVIIPDVSQSVILIMIAHPISLPSCTPSRNEGRPVLSFITIYPSYHGKVKHLRGQFTLSYFNVTTFAIKFSCASYFSIGFPFDAFLCRNLTMVVVS